MYQKLKIHHWWFELEKGLAKIVQEMPQLQRFKTRKKLSVDKLSTIKLLSRKMEYTTMDYVLELPNAISYDPIWMVTNCLVKMT